MRPRRLVGDVVFDGTFDNGYLWWGELKMFRVRKGEGNRQAHETDVIGIECLGLGVRLP